MPPKEFDIPDMNPDFRAMTEKDLRKGMSDLNRTIREMSKLGERYFPNLAELKDLRKKYKTVWRARPGRAFHDVAGRREREIERKRLNRESYIPPFGM